MIVSIHQPSYWSWLGLLDKIAQSDLFVILDNVDLNTDAYQHRNLFLCHGQGKYMTLPIIHSPSKKINEITFHNQTWQQDHLNKLKEYYGKTPYFHHLYPQLQDFYLNTSYTKPIDVMITSMAFACDYLKIQVPNILSSQLYPTGKKSALVLDICKRVNAHQYLCGQGALTYIKPELKHFENAGIQVLFHHFKHPEYQQMDTLFIEGLSCLDLFFFNGQEKSQEIFWQNINTTKHL